jgi:hypothetical protein
MAAPARPSEPTSSLRRRPFTQNRVRCSRTGRSLHPVRRARSGARRPERAPGSGRSR